MKVMLIDSTKIKSLILPSNFFGNYWITDASNENLVSIKGENNNWILSSNSEIGVVINSQYAEQIILKDNSFYNLRSKVSGQNWILYCTKAYDETFAQYNIRATDNSVITIGNDLATSQGSFPNNIDFRDGEIAKNQFQLERKNNMWLITNFNERVPLYVNESRVQKAYIYNGDNIFLKGLKICILGNVIFINNPNNSVRIDPNYFEERRLPNRDYSKVEEENDRLVELYEKNEYYLRPPRFKAEIEPKVYQLDGPPNAQTIESVPLIFTLGSMFTMGISSITTGVFAVLKVVNGEQTMKEALPSILVVFSMLVGMMLIPLLSRAYTKKQKIKREMKRQTKYKEYVEGIRNQINDEIKKQKQILIDNNVPLKDCAAIIMQRTRNLWERKIEHSDFLNLRLGIGSWKPAIEIKAPEKHFSLDEDELKNIAMNLVDESRIVSEVPITVNFAQKNISAILGTSTITKLYLNGLILQMMTFHSYDNLKIVIFTNPDNKSNFEKLKNTPYCWDNEKKTRYFGTSIDEISQISNNLLEIFNKRKESDKGSYTSFSPYYVIISDDISSIRNMGIINEILKSQINVGFSVIMTTAKLNSLPNECSLFINIDPNTGAMFENELVSNKQISFVPDFPNFYLDSCFKKVSNIPIDTAEGRYVLPNVLSFLEMYNVGNVDQLNSYNRWKSNDPTQTLQAPVGVDSNGEIFKLDLHEKAHGPHGLIAGMTGSGKSEFIITYILSLAVNYHPNEVNFVLIDYKGGGLAGAFENKESKVKLPHLAGTITNLDISDINRSLVSLNSELKRRQKIFNIARDTLNESTIDIYKYQKLYRDGLVKEPIPHLFIISDEFAELKAQQPEFMSELISIARIGRSLGVHLILSTQKPSGVVDDQIWSNSRFRVCLKVQEKNDSMDMIKTPDAASLKEVGRFYLQVGYNEYFALGQSAWAGAQYYETDKRKIRIDNSINFVNNLGNSIKTIESSRRNNIGKLKGEELPNIVNYLIEIASKENVVVPKLWLDKIPEVIFVDKLKKKYNYRSKRYIIDPVIGEYDAPSEQRQNILTLPLTKEGNTLIYGIVGSGKELLLNTIIYSSISEHDTKELNLYIIDLGAETLKVYRKAPQVGDVILSGEGERIANLFKYLKNEVVKRKNLFQEYNGDYVSYVKSGNQSLPTIVVIINQIEIFQELYSEYDDFLNQITRDSSKYGIIFVITASGINNVRYKLSQNFKQKIALQLNDRFDYTNIVGSTGNLVPSKSKGRGLINIGNVYEFQTAYPYKEEQLNDYLKRVCDALIKTCSGNAYKIPVLPEIVDFDFIKDSLNKIDDVPVGVSKETLEIKKYDFSKSGTVISSLEKDLLKPFSETLALALSNIKGVKVTVFDATNSFDVTLGTCQVINTNLNNELVKVAQKVNEAINTPESINREVIVIYSYSSLKNELNTDNQKILESLLKNISKTKGKYSVIIVDEYQSIKNYNFESWYKELINNLDGIWIGNGVAEQFGIKITKTSSSLYKEIPEHFGYIIQNGVPTLIKVMDSYNDEDEFEVL